MMHHNVYAIAFYKASDKDPVAAYNELQFLRSVFQNVHLYDAFLFDGSRFKEIEDIVKDSVNENTFNFIKVLIEDTMFDQFEDICTSYRDLLIKDKLWNLCILESDHELNAEFLNKLKKQIEDRLGENVEYQFRTTQNMGPGIRIYLNHDLLDLSILGRLGQIKSEVLNG